VVSRPNSGRDPQFVSDSTQGVSSDELGQGVAGSEPKAHPPLAENPAVPTILDRVSRSNSERDPQNHGHSQTTLVGDFGTRGRVPLNGSGISRKTLKVLSWRLTRQTARRAGPPSCPDVVYRGGGKSAFCASRRSEAQAGPPAPTL
jgi:hypothetical protein